MQDEEYRRLAAVEDDHWYFRALHGLIADALQRRFDGRSARILDAGCGTGGLIRRLAPAYPSWTWTGVDLSPIACALARERTPANNKSRSAPQIIESSLAELPFESGSFDAAICADVLYHLDDDAAALRELRRVVAKDGLLLVNVPAHPWLWSYHDVAVSGRRRYTGAGLRRRLTDSGFAPERVTHWNTLLLPLIVARRKLLPAPASGSDVQTASPIEQTLGRTATGFERLWLKAATLPFGSSLFAVAR